MRVDKTNTEHINTEDRSDFIKHTHERNSTPRPSLCPAARINTQNLQQRNLENTKHSQ